MKKIRFIALSALVLLLTGGSLSALAQESCQIGNLNPPVGEPVPEIFQGEEAYAYHVYPPDQCACDEGGFALQTVSMLLYFTENQIPADLVVQGGLLGGVYDPSNDCWLPGETLQESQPTTVIVQEPGFFPVSVQVPIVDFYPFEGHYFLSMRYIGGAEALLAVDDQPMPCTEYINRGNGWQDLYDRDKSGGGKVIVFGDIVCGVPTVAGESQTWGAIKSLYR